MKPKIILSYEYSELDKRHKWKVLEVITCPDCGNCLEVYTDCPESKDTEFEVFFNDSDKVRCMGECGFESAMSVDEDGNSWLQHY